MKAFVPLMILAVACQGVGKISPTAVDPQQQALSEGQDLRESLSESARHLYGPGLGKTLVFTNRPSTAHTPEPQSLPHGRPAESPFSDSDYEDSTKDMSKKGDVASGVILREERDILYLDLTPCSLESKVFTFHSPFVKKRLPSLDCRGKQVDRFLVAQR
jgi:hypothetical protein